jgi:hypothetical protein
MELSKTKSLELIHRRLDELSKSIADLDAANAQKTSIEADLAKLHSIETDLIADDSTKPAELVSHRAKKKLLLRK